MYIIKYEFRRTSNKCIVFFDTHGSTTWSLTKLNFNYNHSYKVEHSKL